MRGTRVLISLLFILIIGISLFACVGSSEFTVNFDSNGGTEVFPVTASSTIGFSIPDNPIREGYLFDGWFWDDAIFEIPFTVNSILDQPIQSDIDLTVYAKWSPINYSISYVLNGGEGNTNYPTTFNIETTPSNIDDPTKEGYTFGGWYSDNEFTTAFSFTTIPAEDITLYAKWNINSYTLQYVDSDGTVLQTADYEYQSDLSGIIAPVTSKTGYTFTGWDLTLPITMPSSNVTVTAQYTINEYTITFNTDEGSEIIALIQSYMTVVSEPDNPIKEGYTFGGWYSDFEFTISYSFTTMPAEDITIFAKWNINSYTLQYADNDGTVLQSADYIYQADLSGITAPVTSKAGYTFTGWDTTLPFAMPASNVTLTARYTVNEYTITFNTNEGSELVEITQDYASIVTAPIEPNKEGYTFGGWYSDIEFTTVYSFTTMPAEDITLYAKWNINSYKLQFVDSDGTVLQTADYEYLSDLSGITTPVTGKTGHTFTGWDINLPLTMPASNVTLTAQYNINQYIITFNSNEGSEVAAVTQDYASIVTAPVEPTKEGYTFGGWYADSAFEVAYSFTTTPAEDIIVYAKWNINQYSITFESNGGSSVLPIVQDFDTIVTAPAEPIKQGYAFDQWYSDYGLTEPYIFITMPSFYITLYAKWTPNLYEVTFKLNNGENDVVELDYAGSELMIPLYTGYIFDGWYLDLEATTHYALDTFPTESITLYAKWSLAIYTISYELFDGINDDSNPEAYTILTDNFIYKLPIKEGHTFLGWYDNELFEGSSIVFQLQGTTGNVILYAKWQINEYELNYYVFDNYDPSVDIPLYPNETIVNLSLGLFHSAALTSYGRVFTWGQNNYGQLGDGTLMNRYKPVDITQNFNLREGEVICEISFGASHSSALSSDGRIFMWGNNSNGRLGDGTTTNRYLPVEISYNLNLEIADKVTNIAMGGSHSAALTSNGKVYMWGDNYYGKLGFGTNDDSSHSTPIEITSNFHLSGEDKIFSISLGENFSSAISIDGRVFTWGYNIFGQLGDGTTINRYLPVEITSNFSHDPSDKIESVSLGSRFSSALTFSGRIFTWGFNEDGQLGDGTIVRRILPVEITSNFNLEDGEKITSSDSGNYHSSAVTSLGRIFTWGYNYTGQLGNGSVGAHVLLPTDITDNFDITDDDLILKTDLGGLHSSAITLLGHVYLWGCNENGQLGNGENIYTNPLPLQSLFKSMSKISTNNVSYDSVITPLLDIDKDGYTFDGWFDDSQFINHFIITSMPSRDVNLVGRWIVNNYNISYYLDNGINNSNNPTTYTVELETIPLLNPTKYGYTFLGWYDNEIFSGDALISISQGSIGDIDLYAKWEINQYTIGFNSNEGSLVGSIVQDYGTVVTAPVQPTRQGYVFGGWYSNQSLTSPYLFTNMPAENITLYAKWNPNVYIVTFVLNNGEDNIVEVDYAGSELLIPTYLGHEFAGWFTNAALTQNYESITYPTSNITLYAKWNLVYSITFNLDGGINNKNNPSTYTIISETISLSEPTKNGYLFVGWYDNSEFTGDGIYEILQGSIGDIVLYAKWELSQYSVSYYNFENLDLTSDIHLNIGESVQILELGDLHSISLTTLGRVFTWGYNGYGQLGDGTTVNRSIPVEITDNFNLFLNEKIISVYAGSSSSFAVTSLNRIFIWGIDFNGMFDGLVMMYNENSLPIDITSMFQLQSDEYITKISSKGAKIAALSSNGRVFMWGEEYEGILVDDRIIYNASSWAQEITNSFNLNENDRIIDISVGYSFSIALSSYGEVFAWGHNDSGQLGNESNEDVYTPLNITNKFLLSENEQIILISSGGGHASAVTSSGRMFIWGSNYTGQLGDNTLISRNVPQDITQAFGLDTNEWISRVNLGQSNSSIITTNGRVFTWGYNSQGKLGDGTATNRLQPVEITNNFILSENETIIDIWLGGNHSSAITSMGEAFIWGYNFYGSLGDGTTDSSFIPKNTSFTPAIFIHSDTFYFNENIVAYEPILEGYTFLGWYTDVEFTNTYNFGTMPPNNIVLYGKWSINEYTIIYKDVNETIFRVDLLEYNEPIDVLFYPEIQYQFFKEWCIDEELTIPLDYSNMPAQDLTLYAKWREINAPEAFATEIGTTYILFSFTWDNPDDLATLMLIPTIYTSEYMAVSQDWVGFYDLQPNTEYTIYIDAGIGLFDSPFEDIVYVGSSFTVTTLP
ncbi:MAG: InlB B-repeat-containing protein [Acholeplasmataceae bacterium]|nr:InlB B-repeat-containing protein [Acholeplasmataceae bacterium]